MCKFLVTNDRNINNDMQSYMDKYCCLKTKHTTSIYLGRTSISAQRASFGIDLRRQGEPERQTVRFVFISGSIGLSAIRDFVQLSVTHLVYSTSSS